MFKNITILDLNRAPVIATLTCAVVLLMILSVTPAQAGGGGAGFPGGVPLIEIPLRWCVVEGSQAAEDPNETDLLIWRRHERASDHIWIPGANITFRSPFTKEVKNQANFPIIPDPDPPGPPSPGPGLLGDLVNDDNNPDDDEMAMAVHSCREAYDQLQLDLGINLPGPIAINARRILEPDGSESSLFGEGKHDVYPGAYEVCQNIKNDLTDNNRLDQSPAISNSDANANFVVVDYEFTRSPYTGELDPADKLVAHEAGHVLFLWHGNGLDEGDDKMFDEVCSGEKEELPYTVMSQGLFTKTSTDVSTLQYQVARRIADVTSGKTEDPPAVLVPGVVLSDSRIDAMFDAAEAETDLLSAGISENADRGIILVNHVLRGLLDFGTVERQYSMFIDLDNDPSTGGEPSSLGFNTSFGGAEIVTRVSIVDRIATPSAWQFNTATLSFDPVDLAYGFRAELVSSLSIETSNPVSDVVRFQLPGSFIGTLAPEVRFQAIAENTDTGVLDRLPDTSPDGNSGLGLPLFMVAPDYPVCAVTPINARPNETVQVAATGLIPDRSVHVILGADFIATGEADDEGNVDVSFRIPFDAPNQRRLVTVGSDGTALTADCLVNVEGAPVTTPIEVPLDIHPGSCPNPIGQKGSGKIPVAIAGTEVVSPEQVDIDSLRLMGVAPIEYQIEDVSTPFEPYLGKSSLNDCTKLRKDGLADLTLKFDRNILLEAIFNTYGNVASGTVIVLEITGNLLDGASISGEDVIVIP